MSTPRPYARPEYAELDAYRLEKDWSWPELTAAMKRARIEMNHQSLHHLIKHATPTSKPHDRTVFKIRRFLNIVATSDPKGYARAKANLTAGIVENVNGRH